MYAAHTYQTRLICRRTGKPRNQQAAYQLFLLLPIIQTNTNKTCPTLESNLMPHEFPQKLEPPGLVILEYGTTYIYTYFFHIFACVRVCARNGKDSKICVSSLYSLLVKVSQKHCFHRVEPRANCLPTSKTRRQQQSASEEFYVGSKFNANAYGIGMLICIHIIHSYIFS